MAQWLQHLARARPRVRHLLSASAGLLALTGVAIARFNGPTKSAKPSAIGAVPALSITSFRFPDQRGQLVDQSSLKGHVWIADFIFTTCTSACPLITSRLVTLQRRLPDERLRFVSFSVDPERDTETALAQYAARWAGAETRWHLLRTSQPELGSLLAGLHLALERDQGELIHTGRLFLVDAQGALVESYDSTDDAALDQLASSARRLLGVPEAPSSKPVSGMGAQLFLGLGCAGCHSDAQLAPPLGGLAGSHVMLERAGSVLATDAYLAESIADPGSKLVAGYPSSMPNYGALLAPEQLQSLVAYLHSFAAPLATESASASARVDPVCGMSVRVTPQTPSADYQGKSYHFCSAACAQRFKSEPRKYLGGTRAASP